MTCHPEIVPAADLFADPIARRGDFVVERDRQRRSGRMLREGRMDVSYIDLADPTHLEFDYLRWMRIVLTAVRARRVLHIGGGGCALARALAARDPHGRQEVCEIDADVLALAREHLGLRRAPGLHVRHGDGRAFAAAQPPGRWDAVVVDAFSGAIVPRRLVTRQAMAELARVAPVALVNVVDDRAGHDVRTIAAALAAVYPRVWSLGGRAGNTVLVGSRTAPDLDRIAARATADPSPARITRPNAMARALAGTVPLDDAELPPG
jgi:spermidine synthase